MFKNNVTYQRTFKKNKLTLGMFVPIDAYPGDFTKDPLESQIKRIQQLEQAGLAAIWMRDIPMLDPMFGDAGQLYDPLVYLPFLAAHTQQIGLGIGSLILPIRHPIHLAKTTASIQALSNNRLLLGVASGDRPMEFPAFHISMEERGQLFREATTSMRKIWQESFPRIETSQVSLVGEGDILPKPSVDIPMFVTGSSRQTVQWIGENSDGWMYYPRNLYFQKRALEDWDKATNGVFKPFLQSLYIDLTEDPDEQPTPIHLGFRLGRNPLIDFLEQLQTIGVNHVLLNIKYSTRPVCDVLDELAKYVIPKFPINE